MGVTGVIFDIPCGLVPSKRILEAHGTGVPLGTVTVKTKLMLEVSQIAIIAKIVIFRKFSFSRLISEKVRLFLVNNNYLQLGSPILNLLNKKTILLSMNYSFMRSI